MSTVAAQIAGTVASKVISDKIGGDAKSSGADYAASRAAAEYSPWEVSGNYFGTANFDKENKTKYHKGICPKAEKCHDESFLAFSPFYYKMNEKKIRSLLEGFKKTWEELRINDL